MERNKMIIVALIVVIALILIGLAVALPGFSKEKTNITVQGGNDTISQGESINVKLTDVNGTPIDNETVNVTITKVNKTANKTLNKTVKKKTVHTNKKGVAKVKIDEEPGDYIVDCTFSGNDEFEEDTTTAEVEVVDYDDSDYYSETQSDDGDPGAFYSEQEGRTIYTGEIHDAPDGHRYMHLGYNEWEMIDQMIHENASRVCSNCRYWVVDVQLRGSADGVICTMGQGHTNPSDTCPLFLPKIS